jgi:hypothetical protein
MKPLTLLVAAIIIMIAGLASYFIPIKSKVLYCVSDSERYSIILGESNRYESAEGHTPAINEGMCASSDAKANLYIL